MKGMNKKYLLIGGASLLVVTLILANRGSSGGSSIGQSQQIAASVDTTINGQAYAYNGQLAANAADIAKASIAAGSSEHIALLQTVGNIMASNNALSAQVTQSRAGTANATIAANANVAIAQTQSAAQIASAPAEEATAIALAHINANATVSQAQLEAGALSGAQNDNFDLGLLKLGIGALPTISNALGGLFSSGVGAAGTISDLGGSLGVPIIGDVASIGNDIGSGVGDLLGGIFG